MILLRLAICAILAAATPLSAQDAPTLFFCKKFPGSKPAYWEVTLQRSGHVVYKEDPNDELPVKFQLSPDETTTVFLLAAKLDKFARPLESGLKVARMGDKTFRYLEAGKQTETTFNYTTDLDGQALQDWVERIGESAWAFIELEKTARFDKLGVNKAILQLEVFWDKRRLLGIDQYLPLLDRIAKNDGYLNMARERAAKLAEIFRNPPPPPAASEAKSK
jgi:hypothetical protein